VQEKFERFGEILEIDIKKNGAAIAGSGLSSIEAAKKSCYANVQFTDLNSVCRAISACDGDTVGSNKLKLGFAKAVPTKCVWCCGVAESVKEKDIAHEFGRYGKIQDILILRSRGQALVWFDQVISSADAFWINSIISLLLYSLRFRFFIYWIAAYWCLFTSLLGRDWMMALYPKTFITK
jgi:hypothetical protein